MDLGIKDRVAMVAAASKGLGRACATALAEEGCKVSICSRNAEELERARSEVEAHGGTVQVECLPGAGMTVVVQLPITVSTAA